jgi:hypothetical protein
MSSDSSHFRSSILLILLRTNLFFLLKISLLTLAFSTNSPVDSAVTLEYERETVSNAKELESGVRAFLQYRLLSQLFSLFWAQISIKNSLFIRLENENDLLFI